MEKYKTDSYPQDTSSIESSFKNYLNERENIMNLIKLTYSEGNEILERTNLDVSDTTNKFNEPHLTTQIYTIHAYRAWKTRFSNQ